MAMLTDKLALFFIFIFFSFDPAFKFFSEKYCSTSLGEEVSGQQHMVGMHEASMWTVGAGGEYRAATTAARPATVLRPSVRTAPAEQTELRSTTPPKTSAGQSIAPPGPAVPVPERAHHSLEQWQPVRVVVVVVSSSMCSRHDFDKTISGETIIHCLQLQAGIKPDMLLPI